MKCPYCKRGRVKRLRTYDRGDHIHRNNRCTNKKCMQSFNTIEMTVDAHEKELYEYRQRAQEAEDKQEQAEDALVSLQDSIKAVFAAVYTQEEIKNIHAKKSSSRSNGKRRSAFL